jgi:hypothetical protein
VPKDYIETVTDIRKLIREEADTERRSKLRANIDTIDVEYGKMREQVTELRLLAASSLSRQAVEKIATDAAAVLNERLNGLEYLVKGLLLAVILEVIGGVTIAWIVHGMHP